MTSSMQRADTSTTTAASRSTPGPATYTARGRAAEAVLTLLDAFASGRYFDITVLPEVLTAGQAAALLDVSPRNVRALIERGEVPAIETDSHPGIRTVDLMAFAEDQRLARAEAMSELVRISEELGLYDIQ